MFDSIKEIKRKFLLKKDEQTFQKQYSKKAVLDYPPRSVTIAVSSACTNKCVFCAYHSEEAKSYSNVSGLNYSIDLNDFMQMVDMCYSGRVPRVHICATGEPFLHNDILLMIDYVIAKYGTASIQTSFPGEIVSKFGIKEELLKRKEAISCITTDILSGDPEEHNILKKGSSFNDVMETMEYLSARSNLHFEIHYIVTKVNYDKLDKLVDELARRKINCHIAVANLHPYGFNEFTAPELLYTSEDADILEALNKAKVLGEQRGIRVITPPPADNKTGVCGSFWTRFQVWPVQGVDSKKFGENLIVGACDAVVSGDLKSLGYFFDYDSIMQLWNNEKFVSIRQGLIEGRYPDMKCSGCHNYVN